MTETPEQEEPRAATYRIDADLDDQLTAYAKRTRRSKNSALNQLLADGLERDRQNRENK